MNQCTYKYKNSNIRYSDSGKGNVVVMLHGYLGNSSIWDYFVEQYQNDFRVIAVDLLGHGSSDCVGYLHSMEDQAAMVAAVLKNLRIKQAVFVGHSMGGYVVLAIAELYPNLVKGIALLNSTALADSEDKINNRKRAIELVKRNYKNFVSLSVTNLFCEKSHLLLQSEIENVKNEALKTPLQGIVAAQEGMIVRKDRIFIFQDANYPKLLVLGEKDSVLSYERATKQVQDTDVVLISFPDGHMSPIENRIELATILLCFLKTV